MRVVINPTTNFFPEQNIVASQFPGCKNVKIAEQTFQTKSKEGVETAEKGESPLTKWMIGKKCSKAGVIYHSDSQTHFLKGYWILITPQLLDKNECVQTEIFQTTSYTSTVGTSFKEAEYSGRLLLHGLRLSEFPIEAFSNIELMDIVFIGKEKTVGAVIDQEMFQTSVTIVCQHYPPTSQLLTVWSLVLPVRTVFEQFLRVSALSNNSPILTLGNPRYLKSFLNLTFFPASMRSLIFRMACSTFHSLLSFLLVIRFRVFQKESDA